MHALLLTLTPLLVQIYYVFSTYFLLTYTAFYSSQTNALYVVIFHRVAKLLFLYFLFLAEGIFPSFCLGHL